VVDVLLAGELESDTDPAPRRPLVRALDGPEAVLNTRTLVDLDRVLLTARAAGVTTRIAAIPTNLMVDTAVSRFDPEPLRRLYEAGRQTGRDLGRWIRIDPKPTGREDAYAK
jgi:hypothetical protein